MDGFLVFVVCVCFVVEQGFERRREEGVSEGGHCFSQKIDKREWHEGHR